MTASLPETPSSPSPPSAPPKKPAGWVENVDGKPRIRWGLIASVLMIVAAQISVTGIFGPTWHPPAGRRVPFLQLFFAYELIAIAGIAIVYVELQRQRILSGKSKWQIGLGATMWLTALAAVLFALLGHEYREYHHDQEQFRANQKKIAAMIEIITGDSSGAAMTVIDTSLNASQLACYVQRATFGNDDLAKLIDVASEEGRIACPIKSLWLSMSNVDEAALRESLAKVPALTDLAYFRYPIVEGRVEDATVDAIIKHCPNLQNLSWNLQEFTPEQIARLRSQFPEINVNGKSWTRFEMERSEATK